MPLRSCLLLLAALCAAGAAAQTDIHDTGAIRLQVFNNGSVGARAGTGAGFELVSTGVNGLFDGHLYVGTSASRLSGQAYNGAEWAPGASVSVVTSSFPEVQIRRATFSDAAAPNPLGIAVSQTSYSNSSLQFNRAVVLEYQIRNTTGARLDGIYAGLFADFDVTGAADLGAFDPTRNLVYVYASGGSYFGLVLLGDSPFAGWSANLLAGGPGPFDARVFEGMTTYGTAPQSTGDRAAVLGAGPYSIASGDSVAVRYALVAGTSLTDLRATATAVRNSFTGTAAANSRVQSTGASALRVFDNGYYGAIRGVPADTTFTFGGASPLYEGQLVVAVSPTQISGQPYSTAPVSGVPGTSDWTDGAGPNAVAAAPPFTHALEAAFTDLGLRNTDPAGLTIRQRTTSRTGDGFVVVELDVTSATARSGVYVGMFADYDVTPVTADDRGGYDAATRTVYTYSDTAPTYYGVTLLGRTPSGWNVSTNTTTAAGLYAALTTSGTTPTAAEDRRMLLGAGPFTLGAGVPQRVRFAYVGGTSLADLTANAALAQSLFLTGENSAASPAAGLRLSAAPNPASDATELSFTLDAAQTVRLSVVDVLGREVAVVAEGTRAAGTTTERVDTGALPSGVYTARLTVAGQTVTRRFTVAR